MSKKLDSITPALSGTKAKESEVKAVVDAVELQVVEEPKQELNYSALSIIPVFEDGYRFLALVEIKFNPDTGEVGKIIELERGTRDEIEFMFREAVLDKGIFN